VKQGKRNPWDIKPYAAWTITAPFMSNASDAILGAAYDPATQRVFVSLGHADGPAPVVAVYQLAVGSGSVDENPQASIDAVVSDWSAWSPTSDWSACANGQQTRTEQRTRTVMTPASNGGATPSLEDTRTASQSCVVTSQTDPIPDLAALVTAEVTRQLAMWPRPQDGHDGATGPAGPAGPAGSQGAPGPSAPLASGTLSILMGQRDAPVGTTLVGRLTLAPGVMITVVRSN
jgi:hypothetical protein